jgi:hypothetical protein
MGLDVRCDLCKRDDIATVYYVGTKSTHCQECWSSIVMAEPNFSIDEKIARMNQNLTIRDIEVAAANSALSDVPLDELVNAVNLPAIREVKVSPLSTLLLKRTLVESDTNESEEA